MITGDPLLWQNPFKPASEGHCKLDSSCTFHPFIPEVDFTNQGSIALRVQEFGQLGGTLKADKKIVTQTELLNPSLPSYRGGRSARLKRHNATF